MNKPITILVGPAAAQAAADPDLADRTLQVVGIRTHTQRDAIIDGIGSRLNRVVRVSNCASDVTATDEQIAARTASVRRLLIAAAIRQVRS